MWWFLRSAIIYQFKLPNCSKSEGFKANIHDSLVLFFSGLLLFSLLSSPKKKEISKWELLAAEMNEVLMQNKISTMDKAGNVILDIETLIQPLDKCCTGSPKLKKTLSRKGSCRWDRRNGEEQEVDEAPKKLVVKVAPSQLEQLKQPLMPNKALIAVQSPSANNAMRADSGDAKSKRLKSLFTIHPRKILLLFATVSSMGTMILIYFTLAINRRDGR